MASRAEPTPSGRWRLALTVERAGTAARRVVVTAPADTPAGDVLDALAEHLGTRDAAGTVFAESLLSHQWVRRSARFSEAGLLRGEHLRLSLGFGSGGAESVLNRWQAASPAPDSAGRVAINRPPRVALPAPSTGISFPEAPTPPAVRRFPLGAVVVPALLGLVLFAVIRQAAVALFAVLSPAMLIWNRVEDQRSGRKTYAADTEAHRVEVTALLAQLGTEADRWLARERDSFPPPRDNAGLMGALSARVWSRRPTDRDFLGLRLGSAELQAPIEVRGAARAGAPHPDRELLNAAVGRTEAPLAVSLVSAGTASVVGPVAQVDAFVRWLVCQLCAQHSPRDVRVAGVFGEQLSGEWPTWLPHVADDVLDTASVVFGVTHSRTLLARVTALVESRTAGRTPGEVGAVVDTPAVVVFLDARTALDPAACTSILEAGPAVGVYTVWFGGDDRQIPGTTTVVITLGARVDPAGATGQLAELRTGRTVPFRADGIDGGALEWTARMLAPLADASDSGHASALPDRVLLDELEGDLDSPAARRRAWDAAPKDALSSLLGVATDGPFELDLGPEGAHVLVGGTTGSGKSELLQTMVTSLAARYAPDRVSFLLVDYKGGTAFKDAVRFPHTVGLVTDLDEHLTRRALIALDAEIRRRELLLREANARSLWEMRRAGLPGTPPELLIIVDEFAALAEEVPEFVKGVVDIAARGRALGLRLVLATQRPAGVVSVQIRANVATRIALRVNDDADSRDVIDSRDAAAIPAALPGRAIARVGRELVEFQSAYVAATPSSRADAAVRVRDLVAAGGARADRGGRALTLLESVVEATNKVMQLGHWARPASPWLPALPGVITLAGLVDEMGPDLSRSAVLIGRTDEPERQSQRVLALDLDRHQNLLVYGTTRSGKTTLLRTLAAGIVEANSPGQAQFFVLDFAGNGLQILASAPHCGGVIGADDPGRVARLLRHLRREIDRRKRELLAAGLTSYAQAAQTGAPGEPPRIVVFVDAYGAFASSFERVDGGRYVDLLQRLVADGPSAGIHFVLTADRRAAVPGALSSIIPTRLVLRMAERDDYALLGVDAALARGAALPAGRGFVQGTVEVQVAVVSGNADAAAQVAHLETLMTRAAAQSTAKADRVGSMPADLPRSALPAPVAPLVVAIGISDDNLQPWLADLRYGHLLVAGAPRSGRSTALATAAAALAMSPEPVDVILVAPNRSPLLALAGWAAIVQGATEARQVTDVWARFEETVAAGRPVVVVCDDADELAEPVALALEALARRGRDLPIRFVVAAESRAALRTYSGIIPEVRKAKHGVLLAPDLDIDGELLGVRLRAPVEVLHVPGRGFGIRNAVAELVQIAR